MLHVPPLLLSSLLPSYLRSGPVQSSGRQHSRLTEHLHMPGVAPVLNFIQSSSGKCITIIGSCDDISLCLIPAMRLSHSTYCLFAIRYRKEIMDGHKIPLDANG
ncbi:hypothetical protein F2P81_006358 [Scophthalmus maximus]|uniref:Uncharacterized protein n=1 Tax=Scophthalmus maximus TaxID=52904 RepID=A0A6A4T976_SCOMX|nr:hypothetical protein F2P81_006358 [Scophthalmus maximus]